MPSLWIPGSVPTSLDRSGSSGTSPSSTSSKYLQQSHARHYWHSWNMISCMSPTSFEVTFQDTNTSSNSIWFFSVCLNIHLLLWISCKISHQENEFLEPVEFTTRGESLRIMCAIPGLLVMQRCCQMVSSWYDTASIIWFISAPTSGHFFRQMKYIWWMDDSNEDGILKWEVLYKLEASWQNDRLLHVWVCVCAR